MRRAEGPATGLEGKLKSSVSMEISIWLVLGTNYSPASGFGAALVPGTRPFPRDAVIEPIGVVELRSR